MSIIQKFTISYTVGYLVFRKIIVIYVFMHKHVNQSNQRKHYNLMLQRLSVCSFRMDQEKNK